MNDREQEENSHNKTIINAIHFERSDMFILKITNEPSIWFSRSKTKHQLRI